MSRQLVIVLGGSEIATGSCSPGKEAKALVKRKQEVELNHALRLRVGGDSHPYSCSHLSPPLRGHSRRKFLQIPSLDAGCLARFCSHSSRGSAGL